MKIRRLNLSVLKEYAVVGELCFIKPLGSKLHRLTYIPERYREDPDKHLELVQVLNTLCTRFHKNIYYFLMEDQDALEEFGTTLAHMDVIPMFIETDGYGRDDHGIMIPEIYN